MTTSITTVRVQEACVLLAQARALDDVLELRNQADAMRLYMLRRGAATEAHADAWEIVQHANRRLGQLLTDLPQHPTKGGRPRKLDDAAPDAETSNTAIPVSKTAQLKDLGITKVQASRLEKLGALPDTEFRARVDAQRVRIASHTEPGAMTATTAASEHDGDAWGTPQNYADAARKVLDGIELDPATNERAQLVIRAERHYTRESNGLSQPWSARSLWLNPPYSNPMVAQFCNRFSSEFEAGHFSAGIVLVNACTETQWFQRLLGFCGVCFPAERIAFLDAAGQPVKGNAYRQALLYAGPKLKAFRREFEPFGRVLIEIDPLRSAPKLPPSAADGEV